MKIAITTLAVSVTSLLALGLVMLYSSSMMMMDRHTHSEVGAHMLQMQLIWCVLGFIAAMVVASRDTDLVKKYAWVIFAGCIVCPDWCSFRMWACKSMAPAGGFGCRAPRFNLPSSSRSG